MLRIEEWLPKDAQAPGVAAAIFRKDGVAWSASLGLADAARRTPLPPDACFRWFSITKVVTATAVLQLASEGRLSLADPVRRYLNWGPQGVTVEHLLAHASGLANPIPVRWVHPPGATRRRGVELASKRKLRPSWKPGTRARYTNLGYLVLEALIEAASGQRFDDFVRGGQLAPLALSRTDFAPSEPAASGHEKLWHPRALALVLAIPGARRLLAGTGGGYVALRPFVIDGFGYGGLFGTLGDLIRLGRAHLNDGQLDGARILDASLARAMRDPCGPHGYGHAWNLGPGYVQHGGMGGGYRSLLRLYPSRGFGVAILANAGASPVERLGDRLAATVAS